MKKHQTAPVAPAQGDRQHWLNVFREAKARYTEGRVEYQDLAWFESYCQQSWVDLDSLERKLREVIRSNQQYLGYGDGKDADRQATLDLLQPFLSELQESLK